MPRTMFLVMDMINDLVHDEGTGKYREQLRKGNVLGNTATALRKARAAGVPVGYVRIGFSPDYRECPPTSPVFTGAREAGMFKLGTWGTEVHPDIAPEPSEFDIVKHRVSPFYGTTLEPVLRANRIENLVLCGISTGGVVASGTRDAHDRDYRITILEDCCCALTDEEHDSVLSNLQRFAVLGKSGEIDFTAG